MTRQHKFAIDINARYNPHLPEAQCFQGNVLEQAHDTAGDGVLVLPNHGGRFGDA